MSMNLYMMSASEFELMKLARDPNGLSRLAIGHTMGRMRAFGAAGPGFEGVALDEKAFEAQLKQMGRAAWRQGILAGLFVFFMKGAMRRNFRKMRAAAGGNDDATPADKGGGPEILDLHKSWHTLHYLFTGTAWEGAAPANTLLLGGKEVGEDLGYGPARVLDAQATADFANFLKALSPRDLKKRIDMKKMAALDIYCAEEEDEASKSELMDDVDAYFPMLKDYVATAASRGSGMAIWMS
jgi:hypothetical protein